MPKVKIDYRDPAYLQAITNAKKLANEHRESIWVLEQKDNGGFHQVRNSIFYDRTRTDLSNKMIRRLVHPSQPKLEAVHV